MSFHDIRFPTRLSLGSLGGPERLTEVVALANGHEERNTPWAHSRRRFDAGVAMQSLDDLAEVVAFFEARRGRLHGFRWRDWMDWKSCLPSAQPDSGDQVIGYGDGVATVFALSKTYRSGSESYARPVTRPVAGTIRVAIERDEQEIGDRWSLAEGGVVTFASAPDPGAEITAGYEFDVPVRFDTDAIFVSVSAFQAGDIPDVPVVELRT